jgi:Fic family protein
MAIRNDGDWEGWLKFFLQGVFEVSQGVTDTARAILNLREEHRQAISQQLRGSAYGLRLLDYLYQQPIVSIGMAEKHLNCAYVTAANLIDEFEKLEIVIETTGGLRNRLYRYERYWQLFERQLLRNRSQTGTAQSTRSPAKTRRDKRK